MTHQQEQHVGYGSVLFLGGEYPTSPLGLILLAFITGNSSLEPLLEGLFY